MGRGPGWNRDGFLQAVATGPTNFSMIPVIVVCWRLGLHYELVIGLMTMLTSATYHTCESLNVDFLGYNEGRYHHMDNVFAILSFMAIACQFAPHHQKASVREFVNTASVAIAVVAQLMSPWQVEYTVVPILVAVAYMFLSMIIARRLPATNGYAGKRALLFLGLAIFFFVKGLDEGRDWLRLFHGGWHLSVGAFCYYAVYAAHPSGEKVRPE
eukprot:TRINITY_DN85683_c0_g1_i1.p1 TRINITY_DN85683_c0_g1~~TRINITY_DN85683_c0_g1_i1.p1  ORF type:complete len:213 (-),score=23.28 TRINITY_DN85683_c0_g1_i1:4-642(-)